MPAGVPTSATDPNPRYKPAIPSVFTSVNTICAGERPNRAADPWTCSRAFNVSIGWHTVRDNKEAQDEAKTVSIISSDMVRVNISFFRDTSGEMGSSLWGRRGHCGSEAKRKLVICTQCANANVADRQVYYFCTSLLLCLGECVHAEGTLTVCPCIILPQSNVPWNAISTKRRLPLIRGEMSCDCSSLKLQSVSCEIQTRNRKMKKFLGVFVTHQPRVRDLRSQRMYTIFGTIENGYVANGSSRALWVGRTTR